MSPFKVTLEKYGFPYICLLNITQPKSGRCVYNLLGVSRVGIMVQRPKETVRRSPPILSRWHFDFLRLSKQITL